MRCERRQSKRREARRRWESYVEARQELDPRNVDILASVVGPRRSAEFGG
jgi:hypothetical protein